MSIAYKCEVCGKYMDVCPSPFIIGNMGYEFRLLEVEISEDGKKYCSRGGLSGTRQLDVCIQCLSEHIVVLQRHYENRKD